MELKLLTSKANLEQSRRERCWGACREGGVRSAGLGGVVRIQVGALVERLGGEQGWG